MQAGISYTEAMVAAFLAAVLLLPALQGLQLGVMGSGVYIQKNQEYQYLQEKMEEVLHTSFAVLENAQAGQNMATTLSDVVQYDNGTSVNRQVFITAYDVDNQDGDNNVFSGGDSGVLWIKVELEGGVVALETLLSDTPGF